MGHGHLGHAGLAEVVDAGLHGAVQAPSRLPDHQCTPGPGPLGHVDVVAHHGHAAGVGRRPAPGRPWPVTARHALVRLMARWSRRLAWPKALTGTSTARGPRVRCCPGSGYPWIGGSAPDQCRWSVRRFRPRPAMPGRLGWARAGRRHRPARRRAEALGRVRPSCGSSGCTDEEIDRAVADDVVDLLMVDSHAGPGRGAPDPGPGGRADRHPHRAGPDGSGGPSASSTSGTTTRSSRRWTSRPSSCSRPWWPMDLVDLDTAVQMARVIGSSMARIADAEASPGHHPHPACRRATASSTPTSSPVRPAPPSRPWPACSSSSGAATSRPPPAGP